MVVKVGTNLNNNLTGTNVVDTLSGLGGNDTLNGGFGDDTLIGGTGNDTYTVDSGLDVVIELNGEGIDLVKSSVSIAALYANVENASLTGNTGLNLTGNDLSNSLFGNAGNNILDGGGLGEADYMAGGTGNDTYYVDNSADVVVDTNGTLDVVHATSNFTLGAGIENLIGEGTSDIVLIGNTANNTITANNNSDFLGGGNGNDVLIGGNGNDFLDGGAGIDSMAGGAGNDTYIVDVAGDTVTETGATGTDTVFSAVSFVLGPNIENLTLTGGNINGTGNGLDNIIVGSSGNNVLNGGGGNDTISSGGGNDNMIGGTGDDYFLVDGGDSVSENAGEGTDTVETTVSFTLGANIENLITGAGANDYIVLQGNSENNTISNLQGTAYGELYGNDGNDTLNNGNFGGYLDGGTGADTMNGGTGNDSFQVDDAGDIVNEGMNGGEDAVFSTISYTLLANTENLYLDGSSNINGIGNELDNTISGNNSVNLLAGGDGEDYLDGQGGADIMLGGDNDDTYVVDVAGDQVTENTGEGTDTVYASVSYTLGANVENLNLGSGDINGTGNADDNAIYGGSGANTIDGGGSVTGDYMQGNGGSDTYIVRNAADNVLEYSGEGTDTVQTFVDLGTGPLFLNVENLTLMGTVLKGIGNDLVNNIIGNASNNTLDGKGGADVMVGGAGDDDYYVDVLGDFIIEASGNDTVFATASSYNMATSASGVETGVLTATAGNANLTGNSLNNLINGNIFNNTLDGGTGADSLVGGGGIDVFVVDTTGDQVTGNGNSFDLIRSSTSWNLATNSTGVQNLTLTGSGNLNGTGNSNANTIVGNSGDNTIDGDGGADNMSGGAGNDVFLVDNIGDVTSENAGEGLDTVKSYATHTLGANIENLELLGTGLTGTGNSLNNTITGYVLGSSIMYGMGGDDNLVGGTGNDTFDGGTGADFMVGYNGTNVYYVDQAGGLGVGDYVDDSAGTNGVINSTISWNLGDGNTTVNVHNLNLIGTGTNLTATGTGSGDTLSNNTTGNNLVTLSGGAGADAMINTNTSGTTVFVVDNGGDTVTGTAGATDNVLSGIFSYTLGADQDNLTLTGTAYSGTGNTLSNTITGNGFGNALDGGADNVADTLIGGSGTDSYTVYSAADVVIETVVSNAIGEVDTVTLNGIPNGGFAYTLGANVENGFIAAGADAVFTLIGNSGANNLSNGNSFSGSTLDGGTGADNMFGGGGDDFFIVDNTGDVVTGNGGIDTVTSSVSFTLSATTENLVLTGGLIGTGNGLVNVITGNSGNNTLDGLGGDDTLIGLGGNDIYFVDSTADVVTEAAAGGTDTVNATASFTLGAEVENLILLTAGGAIDGTGNSGSNTITGNSAANTLDGGAGNDVLIGGEGGDTYVIDSASDTVTETGTTGSDTVIINPTSGGFAYTLGATIESGIIAAGPDTSGLTLTGNSGGNSLTNFNTSSGTVTLDGGGGSDVMTGSSANEVFVVDTLTDLVFGGGGSDTIFSNITWNLATSVGVDNLTLTGTGNIDGTGNGNVNIITGNSGNNTLDGLGGVDTLTGGGGNDTYFVDNGLGEVAFDTSGEDTVIFSNDFDADISGRTDIERATVIGDNNNSLLGNTNFNVLTGDNSDNILDGAGGADTMNGGLGNDTYFVGSAGDVVNDTGGTLDVVNTSVTYTLAAGIENGNTNAGGITLTGNSGNNTLDSVSFSGNTLDGGTGADILNGSAGNDTFVVDNVGDTVFSNGGIDTVISSVAFDLNAAGATHLILTGSANINAIGTIANNSLTGNAGNNSLDGGIGGDYMAGGAGNDTYFVENGSDTVVELFGQGNDTVVTSLISYGLGTDVENLILTGSALFGLGNNLSNNLTGNAQNNVLDGGFGADAMTGGAGDDDYFVDNTSDQVFESAGQGTDEVFSTAASFTLGANVENLTLQSGGGNSNGTGNGDANVIIGNEFNNTLDGAGGADILTGGDGNDTYVTDQPGDVLNENANEGTDTVRAGYSFALQTDFENLTLTGTGDFDATGNDLANTIIGNSGSNSIDGGIGADAMSGGGGDDYFVVNELGDTVSENFGEGTDTVNTIVSFTLGANIENLITGVGPSDNLILTGNNLVNIIDNTNGGGGDTLDGQGGADIMIGSVNDDTFIVDNASDSVTSNGGDDQILSGVTYNLSVTSPTIHVLTLTGGSAISATGTITEDTLTGNNAANTLIGGGGNDTLDGQGGTDVMNGGAGDDVFYVAQTTDVVTELNGDGFDTVFASVTYLLGNNVEAGHISSTGTLTGNSGANTLDTNASVAGVAVTLNGGTGADVMSNVGFDNNVTFIVDDAGDQVFGAALGNDTVVSSTHYTITDLNVENLSLSGTGAFNITGNTNANSLTGNSGANVIDDGGPGFADIMNGGGGNDTYVVHNSGDQIIDSAGTDTIQSTVSFDMAANAATAEHLLVTSGADVTINGNSLANTITGNAGFDNIHGQGSNDRIDGGAGNDSLYGDAGNDILIGGLDGDYLDGGIGKDSMTGGSGVDTFHFSGAVTAANADVITDFQKGAGGDIIDVSNILIGYNGLSILEDFVQVTGSQIKVDVNGFADGKHTWVLVATTTGVALGTSEATLFGDGNLIVN